jgi:hypothetical protein
MFDLQPVSCSPRTPGGDWSGPNLAVGARKEARRWVVLLKTWFSSILVSCSLVPRGYVECPGTCTFQQFVEHFWLVVV